MKICVYGGQFGSEGKGSIAEAVINKYHTVGKKLVVFGDNSPNSGHTNSLGKTRNIPVSAFFANAVIMGPDSVIDPVCLVDDITAVMNYRASIGNDKPFQIYIHQNAALLSPEDRANEEEVVNRISSTGSGSGIARVNKQFHRNPVATVGGSLDLLDAVSDAGYSCVSIINNNQYFMLLESMNHHDLLYECSQGSLLDVNFGYFPHVTSRSTLARVAIERNGLGFLPWKFCGVYRTYPIRTGGPSGPTGGKEIKFEDINVPLEIATVTRRVRRIFEFSADDFALSLELNRPDMVAFTHLDYCSLNPSNLNRFMGWLSMDPVTEHLTKQVGTWILSNQTGKAVFHE